MHKLSRRFWVLVSVLAVCLLVAAPAEAVKKKGKAKKAPAPAAEPAAPAPAPAAEPAAAPAPAPAPAAEPAAAPAASTPAEPPPPADSDSAPRAAAEPTAGGYPGPEIQRPLVLPPMTLEARGGALFSRLASVNIIGLYAGAGFGVIEGLEAGIGGGFFNSGPALGVALLLSPDFDTGDLPLYGMYDLTGLLGVDGLDLAGRLSFNLPLSSDFSVLADAPARFRINDMIAVIGSAGVGAQIGDGDGLLLSVNAGALFQATDMIAVSATFGMLLRAGSGSSIMLPLAVRGEFNIIEPLDAYVDFSFVDLNNAGADWILVQGGVAYRFEF
jgi:hypothetical protein